MSERDASAIGGIDEPEGTHTHWEGPRGGRIFVKSPGNLWTAKGGREGNKDRSGDGGGGSNDKSDFLIPRPS